MATNDCDRGRVCSTTGSAKSTLVIVDASQLASDRRSGHGVALHIQ
jgi:hypothetical protein